MHHHIKATSLCVCVRAPSAIVFRFIIMFSSVYPCLDPKPPQAQHQCFFDVAFREQFQEPTLKRISKPQAQNLKPNPKPIYPKP